MPEATKQEMSKLFSELTGRAVLVAPTKDAESKAKQMYGVYNVLPDNSTIVVKADMPLLGSFAGSLLGLPSGSIKDLLAESPVEENLRDAMYEFLNISSTVVETKGRAVFEIMTMDPLTCKESASQILKKAGRKSSFDITINGYVGGKLTIFAQV